MGSPGGSVVKNPPANAGNVGSIPASGRSPKEGNGNTLHVSVSLFAKWDTSSPLIKRYRQELRIMPASSATSLWQPEAYVLCLFEYIAADF